MLPVWDEENAGKYIDILKNEFLLISLRVIPGQPVLEFMNLKTAARYSVCLYHDFDNEMIYRAFKASFKVEEKLDKILKELKKWNVQSTPEPK